MVAFKLHGLFEPSGGLRLWIERVIGHKVVRPDEVPDQTFPPAIENLVSRHAFTRLYSAVLLTPKENKVSLRIPTAALAPKEAILLLEEVYSAGTSRGIPKDQKDSLAPDLWWLATMVAGLGRFVDAGRVVIRCSFQDDAWWPEWELTRSVEERTWLAAMQAAAPGIIVLNTPTNAAETVARHWVHWITNAALADEVDKARPYDLHPFLQSLLTSSPLGRFSPHVITNLNKWKDTLTSTAVSLVFLVEEGADDSPSDSPWIVRTKVREGTAVLSPVRTGQYDQGTKRKIKELHSKATAITSLLDPTAHGRGTARNLDDGDWDLQLTTEEILAFVNEDVDELKAAGFEVLFPRAWTSASVKAKIRTQSSDEARVTGTAKFGLDNIVAYDWHLSVGDTELTDAEMRELIHSSTDLVKIRGSWVHVDGASLRRVREYMAELAGHDIDALQAKIEKLNWKIVEAKKPDNVTPSGHNPVLESLLKERDKAEEELENLLTADNVEGESSIERIRALALQEANNKDLQFTGNSWTASLVGTGFQVAPEPVDLPPTVTATLRPYQERGVAWLAWMSSRNLGAVLADDMGLGKTLQVLSLIAYEREQDPQRPPTLVVAPTSVISNWKTEAERFVPSLKVALHHGSSRKKGEELARQVQGLHILVTSYGTVVRDFLELQKLEWDHVIVDEAQAVKNTSTTTHRAVRSIHPRQRIALTGTPVENRLSEMRAILDFCNPGILGSATFFRNHFARPIERDKDSDLARRFQALTQPFILRRLKTDTAVIDELPEKREQVITVKMTPEQAALYKSYVDDVQRKLQEQKMGGIQYRGIVLASLTRIKQICNHPAHFLGDGSEMTHHGKHRSGKVEKLMEIVDAALLRERRVLIFTQYTAFGTMLQHYLAERTGIDIPFLHGGVPQKMRTRMVADFQSEGGPPIFILSLKAGGTGLNLTAATEVVHMDRWWNPAVEDQATDRAYRIGQESDVHVYKMVAAGTLEEKIQKVLEEKTALAGSVVGTGEGWITELDPQQLSQLMAYRSEAERTAHDVTRF